MRIIRIRHEDFSLWSSQIEDLFNSSVKLNFPDADVGDSYGRDKCRELARFLKDGSAIVFAAAEGSLLAGWVWCHEIRRPEGKRIHIAEIAVAEEWRRQGVGRQLLEKVEAFAQENGYQAIDLLVTAGNASAVMFYEKADFKPERFLMKKTVKKDVHARENTDA